MRSLDLVFIGSYYPTGRLSLKDINLQSVVHSGTCQVTFTARDVGVSIRIRGMVQDGYVRDIDNS